MSWIVGDAPATVRKLIVLKKGVDFNTVCVQSFANMVTLPDYIIKIGDEAAAKLFGVKPRTAMSWRLRRRFPTKDQADIIVSKSPVSYDGIFSVERFPDVWVPRRKAKRKTPERKAA